MGLSKFTVQASHPACYLCGATRDREDVQLLLEPLSADHSRVAEMLHLTVVATTEQHDHVIQTLSEACKEADVLHQDDHIVSLLIAGVPNESVSQIYPTLSDVCGPATVFHPGIVAEGWMTLPFYAVDEDGGADVVRRCKDALDARGFEFRLVRFGDFDPREMIDPEGGLTDKQIEAVRVAFSMGYYETPRRCTLDDLADVFGISKAAVHMRLRTAERKIVGQHV